MAGIDGCRGGWLVVLRDLSGAAPPLVRIVATCKDALSLPEAPRLLAIDIPIGLPDRSGIGGRAPDVAARAVLGRRQSSVFSVPSRAAVMAPDYASACAVALATSDPPRKVSKQAYQLFARMREIDALMTPELQQRIVECHPEAAFWAMNGSRPLELPKKIRSRPNEPGLALRRALLAAAGFPESFLAETRFRPSDAGADDFLDACACAWTAGRVLAGEAMSFPATPPRDSRGLRQEIRA
ncbi:MAG: DUF429 domain-containing protein [Hyphomicrobiaceae bacterium]|nr:DUF429 domain-containing protein [Hyphomicrobiaceae bacterium]